MSLFETPFKTDRVSSSHSQQSGVWRQGEISKEYDCNASRCDCAWNMFGTSLSYKLLHTNYCTPNNGKNAIVLRQLQTIASHELFRELLRQKTTIATTPLAESTPCPNSQKLMWHVHRANFARIMFFEPLIL